MNSYFLAHDINDKLSGFNDTLRMRRTWIWGLTFRHACDLSLTLVDLQLDAQNSYLFTYNTFIKILYMFRALPCSYSGGLRRNCIVLVYLSCLFSIANLDDWLTVHRSITLVDLQLDAQNSYLFTYNTFIKILYTFRALLCSSSGGPRRNLQLRRRILINVLYVNK